MNFNVSRGMDNSWTGTYTGGDAGKVVSIVIYNNGLPYIQWNGAIDANGNSSVTFPIDANSLPNDKIGWSIFYNGQLVGSYGIVTPKTPIQQVQDTQGTIAQTDKGLDVQALLDGATFGISNKYLAIGAVVLLVGLSMLSGGKGRRY